MVSATQGNCLGDIVEGCELGYIFESGFMIEALAQALEGGVGSLTGSAVGTFQGTT